MALWLFELVVWLMFALKMFTHVCDVNIHVLHMYVRICISAYVSDKHVGLFVSGMSLDSAYVCKWILIDFAAWKFCESR